MGKRTLRHMIDFFLSFAMTADLLFISLAAAFQLGLLNENILIMSMQGTDYQNSGETAFLSQWRVWSSQRGAELPSCLVIYTALLAAIVILLTAIQHYRYKAVRYSAYAAGAAGCIVILQAVLLRISRLYGKAGITDDTEQKIYQLYMQYSIYVYAYIGLFLLLIGVVLFGLSKKKKG